jgi:hypothetical protein
VKAELPGWAQRLIDASHAAGEDIGAALRLAEDYGKRLPLPGRGGTASRWAVLAAVSERNLTVARVLEAHSDALAILAESGAPVPDGTWGVFAAEAPASAGSIRSWRRYGPDGCEAMVLACRSS